MDITVSKLEFKGCSATKTFRTINSKMGTKRNTLLGGRALLAIGWSDGWVEVYYLNIPMCLSSNEDRVLQVKVEHNLRYGIGSKQQRSTHYKNLTKVEEY